ncbi:hypothetical protein L6269_04485 [Candidatus Dependentiae bacterium]|nr:hypothetical protein [Candidatus Dependentiae bacterium]
MVDVPEWLNDAIESTLVKLKFDSFMNISAKNEFLIKLILLFKDQKNKLILANQFTTELFFIMYRLALIKDFTGIESFLKENSFFLQLISGIKIGKNKTNLKNYLNKEWINFQDIVNYKFEIELKPELEKQDLIKSNDTKTITKIVSAIGLKTSIDYYIAREKFLKTDIGKNLDLKIVNAISLKEKILARQIFTKSLPEYNTILSETQNKIMGFLRRIEGIRNNWNQFVDKIKPYLEPFFDDIGLPFDLIVRKFENLDEKDKSQLDDSQIVFDPELGNISAMDVNQTDYMDF